MVSRPVGRIYPHIMTGLTEDFGFRMSDFGKQGPPAIGRPKKRYSTAGVENLVVRSLPAPRSRVDFSRSNMNLAIPRVPFNNFSQWGDLAGTDGVTGGRRSGARATGSSRWRISTSGGIAGVWLQSVGW